MNEPLSEEGRERAAKVAKAVDPAAAKRQASVLDMAGGKGGRLRQAQREWDMLSATEALLEEQRETNRLLRELLAQRA